MEGNLLQKLEQYGKSDYYPLHMPGHKRQAGFFHDPYAIDITEIDGFDNLFHAEGVLREAQLRAAQLYGAEETYYLVNGSTSGILAAVSACTKRGGHILMARNSHKASYHAVWLNDLRAAYLYPPTDRIRMIHGSISPEAVRDALERNPDIEAVLITSPTYDGVVSDVRQVAKLVHDAGAILIVDEAHGAHFAMHPFFPESALRCGADLVINSMHKTLPSLTQTALLHVQGPRVDRRRLRSFLGVYQSSSPSYVLMAGMDACICELTENRESLYRQFIERLTALRAKLRQMKHLELVEVREERGAQQIPSGQELSGKSEESVAGRESVCETERDASADSRQPLTAFAYDPSKVLISTHRSNINGPQLAQLLRDRYHLEPEMETACCVTAIMTASDTQEGFDRLQRALLEIDAGLEDAAENVTDIAGVSAAADRLDYVPVMVDGLDHVTAIAGGSGCVSVAVDKLDHVSAISGGSDRTSAVAGASERPAAVFTIADALDRPAREILLADSAGCISAEFIYLYPPGIPLVVPGERIPEELPQRLAIYRQMGLQIQGPADYSGRNLYVVHEP